jgi:hypothetical protein
MREVKDKMRRTRWRGAAAMIAATLVGCGSVRHEEAQPVAELVRGWVVSASNGHRLANATVEISPRPPVRADATGQFLLSSPSPGRYLIRVYSPGYSSAPAQVSFPLPPGARLEVLVANADTACMDYCSSPTVVKVHR